MSEQAARAILERMNLREVMVAPIYTALAADLRQMSLSDPVKEQAAFMAGRAERCAAFGLDDSGVQSKPFAYSSGVAIIPVTGTLINRCSYSWGGYITGYDFIRNQVAAAGMDDDVKTIVYDVNSYGGEAAGCFECARDIRILAKGKPTIAIVNSAAYSAGYALACAADKIVLTPSGGTASIGVVMMHVDYSGAIDDAGIVVTFVYAGDHKVDGNPYEKLSPAVKANIQKSINISYSMFTSFVAECRNLDVQAVIDTQAQCYRADEALSLGLIDAIAPPALALQGVLSELSGSEPQLKQEPIMAGEQANQPGAAEQAATTQANLEQAVALAIKNERARTSGIVTAEEAKGRETLAQHLAHNTSMTIDEAKATLAASPKTPEPAAAAPAVAAAPAPNPLHAAMDATNGGPRVGSDAAAGAENGETMTADEKATAFLLASHTAATGISHKPKAH